MTRASKCSLKDRIETSKIIWGMFIFSVIVRIFLSYGDKVLVTYNDELIYLDVARSIANSGEILIHGLNNGWAQIVYSLLIAPFTLFDDTQTQVNMIVVFNCIYMSLSVFPIYLLCKKIIGVNKYTIMCLIITLFAPDFVMVQMFMSENIFYPLSLFYCYIVYEFIEAFDKESKSSYFIAVIVGIIAAILFYTKTVGLYFTIGFVALVIYELLICRTKPLYKVLGSMMSFLVSFGIVFLLFRIYTGSGFGIYKVTGTFRIHTLYDMFFYMYCNIQYILMTLISFFVFPVLIPIFNFKSYTSREKSFIFFVVFTLIIALVTITYLISMKEDYSKISIRYHSRYFASFLNIFLILMFAWLQRRGEKIKIAYTNIMIVVGTLGLTLIAFVLKVSPKGSSDSMLMIVYSKYIGGLKGSQEFSIVNYEIIIKAILIIVIISLYICLIKSKKSFVISFTLVAIIISSINNRVAINNLGTFYEYSIVNNKIEQVKNINNYIRDLEENVLVINPDQEKSRVLDTYIDQEVYSVSDKWILDQLNESKKNYFDLKQEKLLANYPRLRYELVDHIDIIIMPKEANAIFTNVEPISIEGVHDYWIYKNKDISKLFLMSNSFFPENVGTTRNLYSEEGWWNTQHSYIEGKYYSEDKKGALIFGPYEPIKQGVYTITIRYTYNGNIPTGEVIGNMDINLRDLNIQIGQSELISGNESCMVTINVGEDIQQAELRIFTDKRGITFTSAEISKID